MPKPPDPDDGEQQDTVEISSDEEDQEDCESSPTVRESRHDQGAGDTEPGDADVDMELMSMKRDNLPRRRNFALA